MRHAREDPADTWRPKRVLLVFLPFALGAALAETYFVLLVLRWPRHETRRLLYTLLPAHTSTWLAYQVFTNGLHKHGLTTTALGSISIYLFVVVLDYAVLRLLASHPRRTRAGDPITIPDAATLAVLGNIVGILGILGLIAAANLVPLIWS